MMHVGIRLLAVTNAFAVFWPSLDETIQGVSPEQLQNANLDRYMVRPSASDIRHTRVDTNPTTHHQHCNDITPCEKGQPPRHLLQKFPQEVVLGQALEGCEGGQRGGQVPGRLGVS
jgi:hypothetical protein